MTSDRLGICKKQFQKLQDRLKELVAKRQQISRAINQGYGDVDERAMRIRESEQESNLIRRNITVFLESLEEFDYLKSRQLQRDWIAISASDAESLGEFDLCDLKIAETATMLDQVQMQFPEVFQSSKKSPSSPVLRVDVPNGTSWEDVTIELSNDRTIQITVKGSEICDTRRYEEAGFVDRRGKARAVRSWNLLARFAHEQAVCRPISAKEISRLEKDISDLRSRLRNLLPIDGDPVKLEGTRSSRSYRPTLTIRKAKSYHP